MIIKDLMNCGKQTQCRLREQTSTGVSDNAELELLRHKPAELRELQRYMLNGNRTSEYSREKYIDFVKSKFDYKLIAERFNTTRESLDVFAARQDKRLERTIQGFAAD